MSQQTVAAAFEIFDDAASVATAPLLTIGVGVLLYLVCDIVPRLRAARGLAFCGTILVALFFELRILGADVVPGLVLDKTFHADHTTALFGCVFLLGTLLAWAYSVGYYHASKPFKPEHDALMLGAPAGMMLMVGANDLIVFFIGLELLSLPLYCLAAFKRSRIESVEAGVKYFLLGSFASAMLLYGSALVYTASGTLSIPGLLDADLSSSTAVAGLALIAASLFFKVSVFPFHMWVPDVYQGSPTPVTALMATGTKAAAFGFLVAQVMPLLPPSGAPIVAVLGLVTMALGNLGALVQSDLKRMLAYSGVAHAGTLLLVVAGGMAGADAAGALNATLYYMVAYVFTATGAFGLLALMEADGARFTKLDSLRGLAKSRPGVAGAMALFMLSLGGIPATGGFLGKWFAFSVLVDAGMIGTAIIGALLSVVALGYYLRVIVVMYMQPASDVEPAPTTQRPMTAGIATIVCGVFVLATGLLPSLFLAPLAG